MKYDQKACTVCRGLPPGLMPQGSHLRCFKLCLLPVQPTWKWPCFGGSHADTRAWRAEEPHSSMQWPHPCCCRPMIEVQLPFANWGACGAICVPVNCSPCKAPQSNKHPKGSRQDLQLACDRQRWAGPGVSNAQVNRRLYPQPRERPRVLVMLGRFPTTASIQGVSAASDNAGRIAHATNGILTSGPLDERAGPIGSLASSLGKQT